MTTRQEAEKYLEKFIPKSIEQKFPADHGLKRASYLLELLDNPQEKFRTVHVAGTSGKGTTALTISLLLISHGKNTGLHLSPHLEDVRERMMLNNSFISDEKFLTYLGPVLNAAEKCTKNFDAPSYFEVLTSLAFYVFAGEKVDIAVVETGMGGTFDATNTIKRQDKVCVITRIGKDHTNILGKTLKEIASQKAGIIQERNRAIVLSASATKSVFLKRACEKKADITFLTKDNVQNIQPQSTGSTFDFRTKNISLKELSLSLLGRHQVENASLALLTTEEILKLEEKKVRKALNNIRFKGRMDVLKKNNKTIIIDGAHNEQKMKALVGAIKEAYPKQKFTTIVAVKRGKDLTVLLRLLHDITDTLITTSYFKDNQDLLHIAHDSSFVAQIAKREGFKKVLITSSPTEAIKIAMMKKKNNYVLTTGSLYYLQDIYKYLEE